MNYIDVGEEGKIFFDKFNKLEDFNKKNTDLIDNEELNRGILIKLPYNKPEDIEAETHPILKDLGKLGFKYTDRPVITVKEEITLKSSNKYDYLIYMFIIDLILLNLNVGEINSEELETFRNTIRNIYGVEKLKGETKDITFYILYISDKLKYLNEYITDNIKKLGFLKSLEYNADNKTKIEILNDEISELIKKIFYEKLIVKEDGGDGKGVREVFLPNKNVINILNFLNINFSKIDEEEAEIAGKKKGTEEKKKEAEEQEEKLKKNKKQILTLYKNVREFLTNLLTRSDFMNIETKINDIIEMLTNDMASIKSKIDFIKDISTDLKAILDKINEESKNINKLKDDSKLTNLTNYAISYIIRRRIDPDINLYKGFYIFCEILKSICNNIIKIIGEIKVIVYSKPEITETELTNRNLYLKKLRDFLYYFYSLFFCNANDNFSLLFRIIDFDIEAGDAGGGGGDKEKNYNIKEALDKIKRMNFLNTEKYFFSLKKQNPDGTIFIEQFQIFNKDIQELSTELNTGDYENVMNISLNDLISKVAGDENKKNILALILTIRYLIFKDTRIIQYKDILNTLFNLLFGKSKINEKISFVKNHKKDKKKENLNNQVDIDYLKNIEEIIGTGADLAQIQFDNTDEYYINLNQGLDLSILNTTSFNLDIKKILKIIGYSDIVTNKDKLGSLFSLKINDLYIIDYEGITSYSFGVFFKFNDYDDLIKFIIELLGPALQNFINIVQNGYIEKKIIDNLDKISDNYPKITRRNHQETSGDNFFIYVIVLAEKGFPLIININEISYRIENVPFCHYINILKKYTQDNQVIVFNEPYKSKLSDNEDFDYFNYPYFYNLFYKNDVKDTRNCIRNLRDIHHNNFIFNVYNQRIDIIKMYLEKIKMFDDYDSQKKFFLSFNDIDDYFRFCKNLKHDYTTIEDIKKRQEPLIRDGGDLLRLLKESNLYFTYNLNVVLSFLTNGNDTEHIEYKNLCFNESSCNNVSDNDLLSINKNYILYLTNGIVYQELSKTFKEIDTFKNINLINKNISFNDAFFLMMNYRTTTDIKPLVYINNDFSDKDIVNNLESYFFYLFSFIDNNKNNFIKTIAEKRKKFNLFDLTSIKLFIIFCNQNILDDNEKNILLNSLIFLDIVYLFSTSLNINNVKTLEPLNNNFFNFDEIDEIYKQFIYALLPIIVSLGIIVSDNKDLKKYNELINGKLSENMNKNVNFTYVEYKNIFNTEKFNKVEYKKYLITLLNNVVMYFINVLNNKSENVYEKGINIIFKKNSTNEHKEPIKKQGTEQDTEQDTEQNTIVYREDSKIKDIIKNKIINSDELFNNFITFITFLTGIKKIFMQILYEKITKDIIHELCVNLYPYLTYLTSEIFYNKVSKILYYIGDIDNEIIKSNIKDKMYLYNLDYSDFLSYYDNFNLDILKFELYFDNYDYLFLPNLKDEENIINFFKGKYLNNCFTLKNNYMYKNIFYNEITSDINNDNLEIKINIDNMTVDNVPNYFVAYKKSLKIDQIKKFLSNKQNYNKKVKIIINTKSYEFNISNVMYEKKDKEKVFYHSINSKTEKEKIEKIIDVDGTIYLLLNNTQQKNFYYRLQYNNVKIKELKVFEKDTLKNIKEWAIAYSKDLYATEDFVNLTTKVCTGLQKRCYKINSFGFVPIDINYSDYYIPKDLQEASYGNLSKITTTSDINDYFDILYDSYIQVYIIYKKYVYSLRENKETNKNKLLEYLKNLQRQNIILINLMNIFLSLSDSDKICENVLYKYGCYMLIYLLNEICKKKYICKHGEQFSLLFFINSIQDFVYKILDRIKDDNFFIDEIKFNYQDLIVLEYGEKYIGEITEINFNFGKCIINYPYVIQDKKYHWYTNKDSKVNKKTDTNGIFFNNKDFLLSLDDKMVKFVSYRNYIIINGKDKYIEIDDDETREFDYIGISNNKTKNILLDYNVCSDIRIFINMLFENFNFYDELYDLYPHVLIISRFNKLFKYIYTDKIEYCIYDKKKAEYTIEDILKNKFKNTGLYESLKVYEEFIFFKLEEKEIKIGCILNLKKKEDLDNAFLLFKIPIHLYIDIDHSILSEILIPNEDDNKLIVTFNIQGHTVSYYLYEYITYIYDTDTTENKIPKYLKSMYLDQEDKDYTNGIHFDIYSDPPPESAGTSESKSKGGGDKGNYGNLRKNFDALIEKIQTYNLNDKKQTKKFYFIGYFKLLEVK